MIWFFKQWLCKNWDNFYFFKLEKDIFVCEFQMMNIQVLNWFVNVRWRLKNVVRGDNIFWFKWVKMYNSSVFGNVELLSISFDDSSFFDLDDNGKKD